jgi:adenylosuccinate synthase
VSAYERGGLPAGVDAIGDPELTIHVDWFEGWSEDVSDTRRIADLPANARRYLEAVETMLGVPIEAVSIGPERSALATA